MYKFKPVVRLLIMEAALLIVGLFDSGGEILFSVIISLDVVSDTVELS